MTNVQVYQVQHAIIAAIGYIRGQSVLTPYQVVNQLVDAHRALSGAYPDCPLSIVKESQHER